MYAARKRLSTALFFALSTANAGAQGQQETTGISSRWGEAVTPENVWQEYPRPQLVREQWENLNGIWEYAIQQKGQPRPSDYQGDILVPFCVESALSGVEKPLKPDQELWYRRMFDIPRDWQEKNILLHFGAVDWQATVYLNGQEVGEHKGGSDPFSFDLTPFLTGRGEQELIVKVWDPTDEGIQPRGKQVLNPRGIWYTAVSGIWQTVWLEPVNPTSIDYVHPVADIDRERIQLNSGLRESRGDEEVAVTVSFKGNAVATLREPYSKILNIPVPDPELWAPGQPNIYHFDMEISREGEVLDRVNSYFAMRKISLAKDELGYTKICLNNQPLFHWGVLDQGWWPESLLTPPSDEAMKYDMEVVQDLGFNVIRKHIKVEPARFYFHADTMGLLVWQDMPSGFNKIHDPDQHVKHDADKDWDRPDESARQFEQEWKAIIDQLRFFPSIAVWVPFNEGWGQYDTRRVSEWTRLYDPDRLVNATSGWTDRNTGHMYDAHQYPGPSMEPVEQHPGRAMVLGEFGGLGWPIKGHLWSEKKRNWGYRTYLDEDKYLGEYARVVENLQPLITRGLAGAIYTQTTDVEGEVNGLLTYDRKVLKIPEARAQELHGPLFEESRNRPDFLLQDSEISPATLQVSNEYPGDGWDRQNQVKSAFRTEEGPVKVGEGQELWAVGSFELQNIPDKLAMKLYAHGELRITLNGQVIYDRYIFTKRHYDELNISKFTKFLKKGKNVIGLELTDTEEDSEFDFGIYKF